MLPSAVQKLQSTALQNPIIAFADKTRFPCLYYVNLIQIDQEVIVENSYVLGTIERERFREETILYEYEENCFVAFFPKNAFDPSTNYEIAFEDNQWLVFEINPNSTIEELLADG